MAMPVDVFSVFQPISRFARLIGFAPYKIVPGHKPKHVEYEPVYNFTWTIVHCVLLTTFYAIYYKIFIGMKTRSVLIRTSWCFYIVSHLVHLTTNTFSEKIQKLRLVRLVNKLSRLEHEIRTGGVHVEYKKLKFLTPLYSLLLSIFITFALLSRIIYWIKIDEVPFEEVVTAISYTYATCIRVVFVIQFIASFRIFTSLLQGVNVHLKKSFLHESSSRFKVSNMLRLFKVQTLLKLNEFHRELEMVTREYNTVVSARLLAMFLADFCIMTFQCFSSVNNIFNGKTLYIPMLVFSLSVICLKIVKLIIIVATVNSYTTEVNSAQTF